MFFGALFGWLAGWFLKLIGMAPILAAGASQLGFQINSQDLPSLAAFLGFAGGAFKTRFTFPSMASRRGGKE